MQSKTEGIRVNELQELIDCSKKRMKVKIAKKNKQPWGQTQPIRNI